MNKLLRTLLTSVVLLFLTGCIKEDPCDVLVNGIFYSPDLPIQHNMSHDEVYSFLDLPTEITHCLTTSNLIESILNYRYTSLIMAGSTPQTGYNKVRDIYLGISELESRADRGTTSLKLYQSINPNGFDISWNLSDIGHYMLDFIYLEIISSQYNILEAMTEKEMIELFLRSLEVYDLKFKNDEFYTYGELEYSASVMARVMLLMRYEPFVELYNSNMDAFELTEYYKPVNSSVTILVYETALNYLHELTI